MNRWLTSRLDGQLAPGDVRRARAARSERRQRDPLADEDTWGESTDDAETVRASRATIARALDEDEETEDARTVRMSRMPVSFIGESVFDPETQVDGRTASARWREQAGIDEIDPLEPASLEPELHPPPAATPEPPLEAVREAEPPSLATVVLSLLTGATLGVVVVALLAWLLS